MDARRGISEGMTVYTRDGQKLGKVVAVDDAGLFVERGFFFPREYGFRYADVGDVRDDGVHLQLDREAVSSAMVERAGGLERSRPSVVSEARDPAAGGATGTAAGAPGRTTTESDAGRQAVRPSTARDGDLRSTRKHDEAVTIPVVGTPEPTSPGEIRRATDDVELVPHEENDVNREAEVRRIDRRDPDEHV